MEDDQWDDVINFGRYDGRTYKDTCRNDRQYCEWINSVDSTHGGVVTFQKFLQQLEEMKGFEWRAPAPFLAETRAGDRAHGPCRDLPPLLSSVPARVQGVGVKARAARRPTDRRRQGPERARTARRGQSGRGSGVLRVVRRRHRRVAACQPGRAARAPRADTAAHRGADYQGIRACASARCSCAAAGGTVAGRPPVLCHVSACCRRPGYRCAQDHFREHADANPASRVAAGGAVGGSANRPFFRRAAR